MKNKTFNRQKIVIVFFACLFIFLLLLGRLTWLMVADSVYYTEKARELHERERSIKAARGRILDAGGKVIADNKTVCTISVIHSQITDPEKVIEVLSRELELPADSVRRRVEKYSSIERIKSNVDKEMGDRIREYDLNGVKVDEDYKRYYPYEKLASKVLGFTGGDNQGIIGLEVKYEDYLKGTDGTILTVTDAGGVEIEEAGENRVEPVDGNDLYISLDMNIQSYADQLARQVMETKEADRVSILVMNPKNGEILAMADVPEFDLNHPYEIGEEYGSVSEEKKQEILNGIWRNGCINDTYEPGSTFKVITAAAGLEEGAVTVEDTFFCPGYIMVEDRRIRCHKTTGHGSETFVDGTKNSCNPVFITVGLRIGVDRYYHYFKQFGLLQKTGIDLPGEAGTIMHKKEDMKAVELATVSFGQSFQITPIQLAATVSSIVNGGNRITPHFGVRSMNKDKTQIKNFSYPVTEHIVSEETSATMRMILEQVVESGSGKNGYVEGARVGGKTATSQTLPRGSGRYIASFLGFAPADDPEVLALAIIHNPQGVYYGGQIAAPVVRQLFENILPYLGKMDYNNP
ncbi:penicillin-binding transpeptidase domain-containing protein [Suilimivivens aceti]|uniref:Penicillin-binding transpeptidase domain-containing protein n=1 Tax=Suilimivivens aceti TaxID=2981774 RepID=A0ABT2T1F6_9FIRM|nr:penicillin-binding transpeptidase domain-containing protein [Suilimivivens aceti]MCU6744092.1 penicillin-binding transpeptidase domain-containing protein [Suilimivivens aceti]SCH54360.1 Penicillin-binding protein 2 [uncultured Clostridium sp.]